MLNYLSHNNVLKIFDPNPLAIMKFLRIISVFLVVIHVSLSQLLANELNEDAALLQLRIKNIKHDEGKLFIAVFNAEESFMKDRYTYEIVAVESIADLIVELKLPQGVYAISIFHDVNENNELNTNFIGIPKEPYGFSNNPKITFGPPNFEQTSFDLVKDHQQIEIRLK